MTRSATPVCLVGKYPFGRQSGGASLLRALGRAGRRAGFEPHVFCVGPRTELVEAPFGVVHVIGGPRGVDWPAMDSRAPLYAPWLVPALVRFAAAAARPLLLHGLSLWGWVGLVAARRLQRRGVGAVPLVTAYDTKGEQWSGGRTLRVAGFRTRLRWRLRQPWEERGVRPFERATYVGSRAVLVSHESLHRLLTGVFGAGLPLRRVAIAPESAFDQEPPPPARPPRPATLAGLGDPAVPLVLSLSRHDVHKGIEVLLQALAVLRGRRIAFRACLAGPGWLLGANRRIAHQLGLADIVTIPGQVGDSFAYLRHADVFALPSRGEGGSGSMALLEALQAGLPAVASACDGIPEDVTDGVDGLLVRPGDPTALAGALERLAADGGLRGRLGSRARQTFLHRFAADGLVSSLRGVYGSLGFPAA